jgi:hypothetical protein
MNSTPSEIDSIEENDDQFFGLEEEKSTFL